MLNSVLAEGFTFSSLVNIPPHCLTPDGKIFWNTGYFILKDGKI